MDTFYKTLMQFLYKWWTDFWKKKCSGYKKEGLIYKTPRFDYKKAWCFYKKKDIDYRNEETFYNGKIYPMKRAHCPNGLLHCTLIKRTASLDAVVEGCFISWSVYTGVTDLVWRSCRDVLAFGAHSGWLTCEPHSILHYSCASEKRWILKSMSKKYGIEAEKNTTVFSNKKKPDCGSILTPIKRVKRQWKGKVWDRPNMLSWLQFLVTLHWRRTRWYISVCRR